MTLISFHHSLKYIILQMLPYFLLTAFAGYEAWNLHFIWLIAYIVMAGISLYRYLTLSSTLYLFTHDMLIVTRGVLYRQVDCRSLPQLKGMEFRRNRVLRLLWISHLFCGMQGPPAERISIIGVSDRTLLRALTLLNSGVEENRTMWREHFERQAS